MNLDMMQSQKMQLNVLLVSYLNKVWQKPSKKTEKVKNCWLSTFDQCRQLPANVESPPSFLQAGSLESL